MHQQIFVNLPIKDMARSQAFFRALGYEFDPHFTNEKGASLVLGENLYAMLLVEDFFQGFTGKPIADARQTTEVIVCLSCASRAEVDALVAKAVAAGGTAPRAPQDHGFMYAHGFEDPDGHVWELVHMDASAAANPGKDA
ncbi:VOC family protein [Roseateles violae]|uniref:VOC family protein n=1 Tax=Roseateles violae TaxID=3058042 RepID=A0ABT8DML7_9BURK|nr:VOC family protein [Pelomonas sp. PFR6]MDN3919173.1 VOC family protein [Pelomonas sp. PFR6]